MRDADLFRMALGIEAPWVVAKSDFDAAAKRLDIYLDFARGSRSRGRSWRPSMRGL